MRIGYLHRLLAIALASVSLARAQGTFQNLNFENANIVPISGQPGVITVENALPGWTVDYGNVQQTEIHYNALSLGATAASLNAEGYPGFGGPVLDGNFSVELQFGAVNGVRTPVSISQTGQIPVATQSLLFATTGFSFGSGVTIGNDSLTLFPVGTGMGNGTSYTIYGANISAWAGQTEPLTFTCNGGNFIIDDISFSPTAIPEPSTLVLTGIGGVMFAPYRRLSANWKC